ncbi:outer membrane protein assembly factor BamB family protein [Haloarchaeobius amylolyticus]|uniref:outer membrane protein assembly factor BamB family protein n=1 Tax=Haloarchaeobius amylolyticus TaxID=1198296 RepID=UPI00226E16BB|nr:PQQ-binding-like beta-propeller repeat protein [Haloarchaeobius amylolyticus]
MRGSRRALLGALGSGLALAGCLRLESDGGGPAAGTTTDTATETTRPVGTDPPETEATTEQPEPVTALSGRWAQFRGGPANAGVAPDATGPTGEVTETWRSSLPDGIDAYSSPVVADGRAFVLADDALLRAVDTKDGSVLWEQQFPADADDIGSPAVADGTLFAGPLDGGTFYALDAASGAYRWQTSIESGSFASPTVADGTVYVAGTEGTLYALDAADGSKRWAYDTGGRTVLGSPAVVDDTVYVPSTTANELPDGTDDLFDVLYYDTFYQWGNLDEEPHATATELDAEGTVHAVATGDGAARWTRTLPDFVVSTPAVVDGTLYVGCWDANVYALDTADGATRWRSAADAPVSSSPAVADGVVYCGDWAGNLHAFDAASGGRQWFLPVGEHVGSSPAVAGDTVFVAGDNNAVVGVATSGRQRWQFQGGSGDFNASSPAVVGESVLVCGDLAEDTDSNTSALFRLDPA